MSAVDRLHPGRGWWAKFDRAQEHLIELQRVTAPFAATREYPITKAIESKKRPREWIYRVKFDIAPDQNWCLIVGDFLFNLTAALDHVAVALNPSKRKNDLIYFPCYFEDPWRRDSARRYVERNPANRKGFTNSTRDMLPEARAYIEACQPYAMAGTKGKDASDHVLVTLRRLHVTDKHRRLLAIRAGGTGGQLSWTDAGSGMPVVEDYVLPLDRLAHDEAEIKRLDCEVDMKFVGALSVAFARSEPTRKKLGIGPVFTSAHFARMSDAVETRLANLEPYIRW